MKSGEDFRRAMGQADDGFVRVIAQVLSDLRVARKRRAPRRRTVLPVRQNRTRAVSQDA